MTRPPSVTATPLRFATIVSLIVILVGSLLAAGSLTVPSWGGDSAEVYFRKMLEAEEAVYQSRQLVVYLGSPQSAAVLDVRSTERGRFIRAEAGSGEITRIWRHGGRGMVTDARTSLEDVASGAVPIHIDDVFSKYDVQVGEPSSVLGVPCIPLDLVRRKDRRLIERLWVHADSGMVYRRELFGETGALVGMSTVLEMRWGESEEGERPEAAGEDVQLRSTNAPGDAPRTLPYGYRLRKSFSVESEGAEMDHWVYSDGLHALSVFRSAKPMSPPERFERVELQSGTAWSGPGPGTWIWQGDGSTWVVVAEEPQLDPEELTKPFPRGDPSRFSRLGSWWARAWHWVADRFR